MDFFFSNFRRKKKGKCIRIEEKRRLTLKGTVHEKNQMFTAKLMAPTALTGKLEIEIEKTANSGRNFT